MLRQLLAAIAPPCAPRLQALAPRRHLHGLELPRATDQDASATPPFRLRAWRESPTKARVARELCSSPHA